MIPRFNIKEIRSALDMVGVQSGSIPIRSAPTLSAVDLGDVKGRFNVFRWGGSDMRNTMRGSVGFGPERVSWMWVPKINMGVHRGMVDITEASSHQVLGIPGDPMKLMEKYWNFPFRYGMTVNEFGDLYEQLVYRKCAYLPKKEDWTYKIPSMSLLFNTRFNTGIGNTPWTSHSDYPKGWYPSEYGPRWVLNNHIQSIAFNKSLNDTATYIQIKAPTFTPCDSAVTVGQGLPK